MIPMSMAMDMFCTWGSVEQHASRWLYVVALKELRIHEWQKDHLFEGLDIPVQASNLIKANAWIDLRHMTACWMFSISQP